MKEIEKFSDVVDTISTLPDVLDAPGSSTDVIFAEAIIANEPTTVLEENNIITVKTIPSEVDQARFPIVRNTQFTWTDIDPRSGSNVGSELTNTALSQVVYKNVRPIVKSASIFMPDAISLLNKADFELFAQLGAVESKRKKEYDAIGVLGSEGNHAGSV